MSYEAIWEPHGVLKRYWGHVSNADLAASSRELYSDPRFDEVKFVINDFTAVVSHSIDEDALLDYVAGRLGVATYMPDVRGACVANTLEMLALSRKIANPNCAIQHDVRVFSSMAEARNWLKS